MSCLLCFFYQIIFLYKSLFQRLLEGVEGFFTSIDCTMNFSSSVFKSLDVNLTIIIVCNYFGHFSVHSLQVSNNSLNTRYLSSAMTWDTVNSILVPFKDTICAVSLLWIPWVLDLYIFFKIVLIFLSSALFYFDIIVGRNFKWHISIGAWQWW